MLQARWWGGADSTPSHVSRGTPGALHLEARPPDAHMERQQSPSEATLKQSSDSIPTRFNGPCRNANYASKIILFVCQQRVSPKGPNNLAPIHLPTGHGARRPEASALTSTSRKNATCSQTRPIAKISISCVTFFVVVRRLCQGPLKSQDYPAKPRQTRQRQRHPYVHPGSLNATGAQLNLAAVGYRNSSA